MRKNILNLQLPVSFFQNLVALPEGLDPLVSS